MTQYEIKLIYMWASNRVGIFEWGRTYDLIRHYYVGINHDKLLKCFVYEKSLR